MITGFASSRIVLIFNSELMVIMNSKAIFKDNIDV